ncbi:uncharacterized protein si:rp71-17i16.6 [Xyrauchen texanus]|uniref:uncharacterized protein si:rp71-17i16.6 n=1 Tax=Xyrauchen texanus TaxID=154827 RepID=UPI002242C3E1|nr:uncharacterized protein si:rp71-17i16.6 [Xyrauchen texanus]
MEPNMEKVSLIQNDCNLKCRQDLISLFGESTAEYFLSPSSRSKDMPPWFLQLQEEMRDHIRAGALWDALSQRSAQILQESNTEPLMITRRVTDWKTLIKQDHLKHLIGVKYMFRCAQRNQAISALLLQCNPPF